jgi:DNA mismatch repair protein MutS
VPAKAASISLVDRIFTRIGAGDNLAEGKSTFLIEMEETASICTQATKNSLVILDEVGRGTSTFDGLAIAQAVIEYIYTHVQARCLFATHYHELTSLTATYPGIVSYYAASKKSDKGILFLHKMIRGVADGSFGVEVARLAHLPQPIIARAEQILSGLASPQQENYSPARVSDDSALLIGLHAEIAALQRNAESQLHILEQLQAIDYNDLSPKAAFDILWKLKESKFQDFK